MNKLKLYLDNCCFSRPFDDQNQLKIYLETQAKLAVQEKILLGEYSLVWSYILDYENEQNPHDAIKREINKWQAHSELFITESTVVLEKARSLRQSNIEIKDALHVACAICATVDYFITTDRKLLNKLSGHAEIRAVSPITVIEATVMIKSDAIILNEAMTALGTRLNAVEIEKFIVLVNRNGFDYQQWRTHLWQEETLESLSSKAQKYYEIKQSV